MSKAPAAAETKPKSNVKVLRRLLSFARKPPVQGFVDRVVAGEVHGWAWDPARPDRRLLVVVTLDGAVQAETLAELPRQDLATAGKGDGKHGFRLRLPPGLSAETPGRLQIQVMIGSQRFPLQRGALVLPPSDGAPPLVENTVTVGFIEGVGDRGIKGWAVNPNNPETPAVVDLFDGELFLGSATASLERPRLQKVGAPAGARGFAFKLPDGRTVADGAALRARIAGTRFELRRSKSVQDGARSEAADDDPSIDAPTPAPNPTATPAEDGGAAVAPAAGVLCLAPDDDQADAPEDGTSVRWMGLDEADDASALQAALLERDVVVLLPAGCTLRPGAAEALLAAPRSADVLAWPVTDTAGSGDPRLEVLLGRRAEAALALRSAVLLSYPGALVKDLTQGVDRVAHWAADQPGLRWRAVPVALTEGRAAPPPTAAGRDRAEASPGRITLAAWGPWREGPPPALMSLLEAAEGFEVEVLAPASPLVAAWSDTLRRLGDGQVTVRPLDGAGDESAAGRLALLRAASGEVVVLFDAACEGFGPGALRALWAWARTPGVGAVTGRVSDGVAPLAGLDLAVAEGGVFAVAGASDGVGAGRLAFGAAPILAAYSREALQRAGIFDDAGGGEPWDDDLGWALRLQRRGFATVCLDAVTASVPRGRLDPWMRRRLPLALQAGFAAELRDGVSPR